LKEFTIGYLPKWREAVLKSEETTINQFRRKTPETKGKTMNRSSNQNPTSRAKALVPALLITTLLALAGAALVRADLAANSLNNPGIIPPQATPNDKSYGEWTAAWWQWALSIPDAQNPLQDTTGAFAGVGQSGPVWFLGGTFGGSAERNVTVPTGKSIFMPVHNWIFGSAVGDCDPTNPGVPCDVPTLRAAAASAATGAEVLEAWIDGAQVNNIRDYRAFSPAPFSVTLPAGAVFGIPAGTYYPQVSDSYWLMLAPLSNGAHTIRVHVVNSAFGIDQNLIVHLTVN